MKAAQTRCPQRALQVLSEGSSASTVRGELGFGAHRNVGPRLSAIAEDLRIAIHVVVPPGEPPGQDVGG